MFRYDPAHHDHFVADALFSHLPDQFLADWEMGTGEDAQAHDVNILLERRPHNIFYRLVKAGVNDVHAGVL